MNKRIATILAIFLVVCMVCTVFLVGCDNVNGFGSNNNPFGTTKIPGITLVAAASLPTT